MEDSAHFVVRHHLVFSRIVRNFGGVHDHARDLDPSSEVGIVVAEVESELFNVGLVESGGIVDHVVLHWSRGGD